MIALTPARQFLKRFRPAPFAFLVAGLLSAALVPQATASSAPTVSVDATAGTRTDGPQTPENESTATDRPETTEAAETSGIETAEAATVGAPPTESDIDPEPIVRVVTATRIPQSLEDIPASVEVIAREELLSLGGDDLTEALRYTSGLPIIQASGATDRFPAIRLRGAPSNHTLILVDGLPVNPAQGMDSLGSDLSEIPLAVVERVEIVRGPSSAVWGSHAAAGVVNIITMRPEEAPRWSVQARAGSRGHSQTLVHSAPVGESGGFILSAQQLTDEGNIPGEDWKASKFTGRFEQRISPDRTMDFHIAYSASKRGVGYDDNQLRWSVGLRRSAFSTTGASLAEEAPRETDHRADDRWRVYGQHYRQEFAPSTHRNHTIGAEWAQDFHLSGGQAHIGASIKHEQAKSTNFPETTPRRLSGSLALEAIHDLTARMSLVSGLRADAAGRHNVEFSPRLGLVYDASSRTRYRAQIGRVFRLPSFNELYWDEAGETPWGRWTTKGNPDLRPERGWAYELGGDHQLTQGWSLGWTLFHRLVHDLIVWDYSTMDTVPYNVDARASGLELSASYVSPGPWGARVWYTYVDVRDANTNEREPSIPQHEGSAQLTWERGRTRVGATVRHRSERSAQPAYTVAGGAVRYQLQPHLSLHVEVDNIFDVDYRESSFAPMPGRTVWFRIGYEY